MYKHSLPYLQAVFSDLASGLHVRSMRRIAGWWLQMRFVSRWRCNASVVSGHTHRRVFTHQIHCTFCLQGWVEDHGHTQLKCTNLFSLPMKRNTSVGGKGLLWEYGNPNAIPCIIWCLDVRTRTSLLMQLLLNSEKLFLEYTRISPFDEIIEIFNDSLILNFEIIDKLQWSRHHTLPDLRGLSPRANYTYQATATCRRR
jgi:hypothetical protein